MSVVADPWIWITANYKETQLSKTRVGWAAEIDVDAYPGWPLLGEVERLRLRPGMSVEAHVRTG